MIRPILGLSAMLALVLAACASPPAPQTPEARANAETSAACRQRADQIYELRHRDAIYAQPEDTNTPSSAGYAPGVGSRALSSLFERDSIVRDCVRNTGTETSRTAPDQGPDIQIKP
jgi:hypothetical protein